MVEPTAPPRCLPPWYSTGTVKVPFTVMLPPWASAAAATSRKERPGSWPPLTRKRSPTHSIWSGRASSLRAAAAMRMSRSCCAASIAAFPTMKVTREE